MRRVFPSFRFVLAQPDISIQAGCCIGRAACDAVNVLATKAIRKFGNLFPVAFIKPNDGGISALAVPVNKRQGFSLIGYCDADDTAGIDFLGTVRQCILCGSPPVFRLLFKAVQSRIAHRDIRSTLRNGDTCLIPGYGFGALRGAINSYHQGFVHSSSH